MSDNCGNAPSSAQYAEFAGIVQSKLWPAIKGRISGNDLQQYFMTGPQGPENVLLRLRNGFTVPQETGKIIVPTDSPFFASEEVSSNYDYPEGYAVKPICEQLVALSKHFPNFDAGPMLACSKELPQMPGGAEGPFVVPKWQKVAATYNESFEKALGMIAGTRTLHNYRKGQLGPKHLRQSERTQRAEEMIASMQSGDYLLIWAQFGFRWRGRSVRKVRYNYAPNEFGIGAFHSACMLLSHPERLVQWEQLHIDCGGDEYFRDADGEFSVAPVFGFGGGKVKFGTYWVGGPIARYGSASGFLPQ